MPLIHVNFEQDKNLSHFHDETFLRKLLTKMIVTTKLVKSLSLFLQRCLGQKEAKGFIERMFMSMNE